MATSLNLTRQLTGKTDERLFTLLKTTLAGDEQQLFVDGFAEYLSCNPSTDFVVSLEFATEWLGFIQKCHAKRKLENTLTLDVDYTVLLSRSGEQNGNQDSRGGHNKETIMLTTNGFKMFCLMAGTEKAKRVRKYYLAIENVMFEYTKSVLVDMEFAKAYSRHKALISCNDMISVVYLGCVTINGVQYAKPGHTIDARQRGSMLRTEYGTSFVFAEVMPCERAHQYEQWLLNDSELSRFRCFVTLDGHSKTELLRLSADGLTVKRAVKVVRDNNHYFRNSEMANQVAQARIQLITTLTSNGSTPEQIAMLMGAVPSVSPTMPPPREDTDEERRPQGVNDKTQLIQQYTEDGKLVKVHDSIRDAVRSVAGASVYSIMQAAKENFMFKGFRWLEVDDPVTRNEVRVLPPTDSLNAHVNAQSTIAQIDPATNLIVRTFPSMESAAFAVKLRTAATLTNAIHNSNKSKGFLWKRYDDCDAALQAAFVAAGGTVEAPTPRTGKKLVQSDPISGAHIHTFNTIQEACLAMHGSHKSFNKAVSTKEIYKKAMWSFANA